MRQILSWLHKKNIRKLGWIFIRYITGLSVLNLQRLRLPILLPIPVQGLCTVGFLARCYIRPQRAARKNICFPGLWAISFFKYSRMKTLIGVGLLLVHGKIILKEISCTVCYNQGFGSGFTKSSYFSES